MKPAARRLALASVVLFITVACGADPPAPQESSAEASPDAVSKAPEQRADIDRLEGIAPPDLGLTPLPTVDQVQRASPGGRGDPFAPLPGAAQGPSADPGLGDDGRESEPDPGSGITLTGVLRVGEQQRAFARTASSSGVLCISSDGRCAGDSVQLLPQGWSVLAIDVQRGCIRLADNGKAQDPICIA